MERLYIAITALLGGIAAALFGWAESGQPFDSRKFGGSLIRSLLAAAAFAAGYELSGEFNMLGLLYAFLGGAGVDVIGNRISGSFGNGSFPLANKDKGDT